MRNKVLEIDNDLPINHTHKKKDTDAIDKDSAYYPTKVEIENFWDKDIKIKNKLLSNDDY